MSIPNPPVFCTLSGFVKTTSGAVIENAIVRVRILDGVGAVVGDTALSASPRSVYTDSSGAFSFVLPQGALARIEIPECGLDVSFSVPTSATATLADLGFEEYLP